MYVAKVHQVTYTAMLVCVDYCLRHCEILAVKLFIALAAPRKCDNAFAVK